MVEAVIWSWKGFSDCREWLASTTRDGRFAHELLHSFPREFEAYAIKGVGMVCEGAGHGRNARVELVECSPAVVGMHS